MPEKQRKGTKEEGIKYGFLFKSFIHLIPFYILSYLRSSRKGGIKGI